MAFIGREPELQAMQAMYQKDTFQMLVLYGRRRVGKTMLLNRFSENKHPLFYTGIESKERENLTQFGNEIRMHFHPQMPNVTFNDFSDVVRYLTLCLKEADPRERQLVVLDEYPYMAEHVPELSSVLQREIDHEWNKLNVMLILCGSSITFMEENVLGEKSPLFGRRTGQIDLQPFDYRTASCFVPGYTPEEKAIVYGITGGIPKYLAAMDPECSLKENIIACFFNPTGYFYEEPKNLLRQEFRDVSLYFSILSVMGGGAVRVTEIADKTGLDTACVSQAMAKLEAVRIVRREIPILNEKNKKLTQYNLRDGMFRFWFRFVSKGTVAIERYYGEQYYRTMVEPFLHDYMGPVFEIICREYTFRSSMEGALGMTATRVGKWRGNDPVNKCPADIDVVAVNDAEKTAVIGECKFKNAPFDKEEYDTLLDRARLIAPYRAARYLVFSLSGVTKWVREQKDPKTQIVSIEDLFA